VNGSAMRDELERVILVDPDDVEIGSEQKLLAHRSGVLHRAFSVFVMNARGEILLQRRAEGKYHSAGLWTNTCCGHPRPGEDTRAAAERRLREEMGFGCALTRRHGFLYRVELEPGLWEHEYDHVFVGRWDADPEPDPTEVAEWRWQDLGSVYREVRERPDAFTSWFRLALEGLMPAHLR
jgi:isopentenyl-diphosphate Delta-isomerase